MRKSLIAAAVVAAMYSSTASAGVIVANTGWQNDTLPAPGSPTTGSPWSFVVASNAVLSITDAFLTGDTYTITGDLTGTTTFFAGSASDVQASGAYGPNWTSSAWSKIAFNVGPGSYTFNITGPGQAGTPAGLALRLDTILAAPVPEPATWAMMLLGFGAIGASMRRRRPVTKGFLFA